MAHSHPGAGSRVPSMPPARHRTYSKAFFQACDDAASPFQNGIRDLRRAHSPAHVHSLPSPQPQPRPLPQPQHQHQHQHQHQPPPKAQSAPVPAAATAPALAQSPAQDPVASRFAHHHHHHHHRAVKHETARYSPAADGLLSLRAADDFPSTLELAEGLIMMRSSVEPIHAMPARNPFAHPPPHQNPASPSTNGGLATFPASTSSLRRASRTSRTAAPSLDHMADQVYHHNQHHHKHHQHHQHHHQQPSVSTPSEDNTGRRSDIFSASPHNSDTVSDPGSDQTQRNGRGPVLEPSMSSNQAPTDQKVLSHTAPLPWPYWLPFVHGNGAHQASTSKPLVENSLAVQPPLCRLYDPAAPIAQCSCHAVPGIFLKILDEQELTETTTLTLITKLFAACKDDLCALHLGAYARLVTSAIDRTAPPHPASVDTARRPTMENGHAPPCAMETGAIPTKTGSSTKWTAVPIRRRTTSIPDIYEFELQLPVKRRRTVAIEPPEEHDPRPPLQEAPRQKPPQELPREAQQESPLEQEPEPKPVVHQANEVERPSLDFERDQVFRRQVLDEIAQHFTDTKEDDWSRGETTNRLVHSILAKCQCPNTDPSKGPVDADLFDGDEALEAMERRTQTVPMFTHGQQHFEWSNNGERPIEQLFNRMEDLTKQVSVQIPSRGFNTVSFEKRSLSDVKKRFLSESPSEDPWNALDLRSPLPHSILPRFLTGENCQLLPRIRDSLLEGHSGERTRSSREDWNEWVELLEWVLVSEGGHNTSPHMDSHGWSTWITIQEGEFGFGWLSRPTAKEQKAWVANPLGYTGGNWRFVVLRAGQTVYFPTGTVHFVFRLHSQQTLAVGGHVLQWTGLERWAETIMLQLKNPDTTNEDMGTSPLKYIRSASDMVNARTLGSRIESLGGMTTVRGFMLWVSEIERWFKLEAEKLEKKKKKKKRAR